KLETIVKKLNDRIDQAEKILLDPGLRAKYASQLKTRSKSAKTSVDSEKVKPKPIEVPADPKLSSPKANAPVPDSTTSRTSEPSEVAQAIPLDSERVQSLSEKETETSSHAENATGVEVPLIIQTPTVSTPTPVPAVSPVTGDAAIPMAVPVVPQAVPVAETETVDALEAGSTPNTVDFKISKSRRRRQKNKWLAPVVLLMMIAAGGGGVYLIVTNMNLGIREDVLFSPGIENQTKNGQSASNGLSSEKRNSDSTTSQTAENSTVGQFEPKKLTELDMNQLEEVDVSQVMEDTIEAEKKRMEQKRNSRINSNLGDSDEDLGGRLEKSTERMVNLDREQAYQFRRAILRARQSLFRRDKKVAVEQLEVAREILREAAGGEKFIMMEAQKEFLEILMASEKILDLIDGFWGQVVQSAQKIPGGQEIQVGEQIVGFLEADNDKFIIRNSGVNTTYHYYFTPPGLAVKLANQGAIKSIPKWSMQQAAFYAINQTEEKSYSDQIDELIAVAEDAGRDCDFIHFFSEFDFEQLAKPNKRIKFPNKQTRNEWLTEVRKDLGYANPRSIDARSGSSYAEVLLALEPENVEQRVSVLEEARVLAMRAGDAPRVEDALLELRALSDVDYPAVCCESYTSMAKRKLDSQQTRALLEIAIPFLKSPTGRKAPKNQWEQLGKALESLAQSAGLVDCVRRLAQTEPY
ncbi:MAG: hypothetical protein AAF623_19905, partial [Planctomycetota bacterium]